MRKINKLIVHCSDTPEGRDNTVDDVRAWHVNGRGWSDIGYHFVIHLDGSIHDGRPLNVQGAHTKGYNKDSVGICYIGGADEKMKPKDTRTDKQKHSVKVLLMYLSAKFPESEIYGHRDFSSKDCPSYDAKTEHACITER